MENQKKQIEETAQSTAHEVRPNDTRAELATQMVERLASPNAFTLEYYTPGKSIPAIEREGAAWERFTVLRTTDGKRSVAIHMLRNNPNFREEHPFYGKPRGQSDRLRMVVLENKTNRLSEVIFSPEFASLTETTPRRSKLWTASGEPISSSHPDSGRRGRWARGLTEWQFVRDNPTGNPRELQEEELQELNAMLADQENCIVDPTATANTLRSSEMGRSHGSRVVDATQDPFLRLIHGAREQATLPQQQP